VHIEKQLTLVANIAASLEGVENDVFTRGLPRAAE